MANIPEEEDYWDEGLEALADEYQALDELIESLKDLQIHTPVVTFIVDEMFTMVGVKICCVEDINAAYAATCTLIVRSDFLHSGDQLDMINLAESTRNLCVQCFISTEMETPLHYHTILQ